MKYRARKDPVTPALREQVLTRDKECVAWKFDKAHICRDAFGTPHPPGALWKLTIEHVHDGYGLMGRRAKSDRKHCLALCAGANIGVPSKALREFEREYLRTVAA